VPATAAADLAAAETARFVLSALPLEAHRILDVGCGDGAVAARLKARGMQVTAIDSDRDAVALARKAGVEAVEADILTFEALPFDAVLFSRSLHHVQPLAEAVARARDLVRPEGALIAEELAVERMDRETARWFYELQSLLETAGVLRHDPDAAVLTASPLERWYAEHQARHVQEGEDMLVAIGRRFQIRRSERGPHLYRYLCERLEAGDRGLRVAHWALEVESLRIAERSLAAVGLRIVARRQA
jgi:SAM-dependent methyltransferase